MDAKRILKYLRQLAKNNNRTWFQQHKQEYHGNYWLPTNILTSCRNEIMGNTDQWLRCVRSPEFLNMMNAVIDDYEF